MANSIFPVHVKRDSDTNSISPDDKGNKAISNITVEELMQATKYGTEYNRHVTEGKDKGKFLPNMNIARVKRNALVVDWLRNYKPRTRHHYSASFTELLDKTGRTVEELAKMEAPELKKVIKAVAGAMLDKNRLHAAKMLMKAGKSFSDHFEHPIEFAYSERIRIGRMKNEYVPRPHEVYAIAEAAGAISKPKNPRNRAIVMLDWVTALRENAIPSLRWGAVLGYSEGDCPIPLRVGNSFQKIGQNGLWCVDQKLSSYGVDYYYTFIGKEGFLGVQDWYEWLKRKRGSIEKQDYMFTNVTSLWGDGSGAGQRELNYGFIWRMYKDAVRSLATIDSTATTFHKLRDSWKSVMIRAEVDEEVREVMMGHAPHGSAKNYFDYHDMEMARTAYSKADFSRQGQHRISKVEQENAQLSAAVVSLQTQINQLRASPPKDVWQTIAELQKEIIRLQKHTALP